MENSRPFCLDKMDDQFLFEFLIRNIFTRKMTDVQLLFSALLYLYLYIPYIQYCCMYGMCIFIYVSCDTHAVTYVFNALYYLLCDRHHAIADYLLSQGFSETLESFKKEAKMVVFSV